MKTLPKRLQSFWNSLVERERPQNSHQSTSLSVELLENRLPLATFTVTNLDDSGAGSLRDAIDQANADTTTADDLIVFQSGLSGTLTLTGSSEENNNKSGDFDIRRVDAGTLTIRGPEDGQVTIDADGIDRIFDISSGGGGPADVIIEDLTIQNGYVQDSGSLGDGSISAGGGILAYRTNLTLFNVEVSGNTVEGINNGEDIQDVYGGGVAFFAEESEEVELFVVTSTISDNRAIAASGTDKLSVPEFGDGFEGGDGRSAFGGGVFVSQGTEFSFDLSTISNNLAQGGTGGFGSNAPSSGVGSPFRGGDGGNGGSASGGGIYSEARDGEFIESTLSQNTARGGDGGAAGSGGDADPGYGGGPGGDGGNAGKAVGGGIAVANSGFVTLSRSTLAFNQADGGYGGSGGDGGAGDPLGAPGLTGDGGDAFGGGAYSLDSTTDFINATLSSNSASGGFGQDYGDAAGGGFAILRGPFDAPMDPSFLLGPSQFSDIIYNSTIAFNSVNSGSGGTASGAGIANLNIDQVTSLVSTIVSENIGADDADQLDVAGGAYSLEFSWVGTEETIPLELDTSLAPNGGPTETHALLVDSPAIDTGDNPLFLSFDQRGSDFPRELGCQTDIGAFEYQPPEITVELSRGPSPIQEGVENGELFLYLENLNACDQLYVELSFTGTAELGIDYVPDGFVIDGNSIFVPVPTPEVSGSDEFIVIDLLTIDDGFFEGTETVEVTLEGLFTRIEGGFDPFFGESWILNDFVTIEIFDLPDESIILDLSRGPSPISEGVTGTVFLAAENVTNELGIVVELEFTGTAVLGEDYLPDGFDIFGSSIFVVIPSSQSGDPFVEEISLLTFEDEDPEGAETIIVSIAGIFEDFGQVDRSRREVPREQEFSQFQDVPLERERPRFPDFDGDVDIENDQVTIIITDDIPTVPPPTIITGEGTPNEINRVPNFAPAVPDPVPLPGFGDPLASVEFFGNQINLELLERTTISVYRVENADGNVQLELVSTVSITGKGTLGPTTLLNDQPPGLYRITAELDNTEFVIWQGDFPANLLEALKELEKVIQVLVNERADPLAHLRELLPSAQEQSEDDKPEQDDSAKAKTEASGEQATKARPSERYENEIAWVARHRGREAFWQELDQRGELGSMFDAYYEQQLGFEADLGESE